jgi:hypothetical protein
LPKIKDAQKDIMAPLYDAVTPDFIRDSEWKYHNNITIYNFERVRHRKPFFNYRINYERTYERFTKRKKRRLEKIKRGGTRLLNMRMISLTTRPTDRFSIVLRRLKRFMEEIKPGDITLEDLIRYQTDLSSVNNKYYFKKFPWSSNNNNKPRNYPITLNKEVCKHFKAIITFPVKFVAFPAKHILPFSTDTKIPFPIIESSYIPRVGNFNSTDFFCAYEPFRNNRLFENNLLYKKMPFIQSYLQQNALLAIRNHLTINKLYRGAAIDPEEIDQYYGGSYSIQPFQIGLNASESVLWRSVLYPFNTESYPLVEGNPWINKDNITRPIFFMTIEYPKALSLDFKLNQDNLDTFTQNIVHAPKVDLYNTKKHLEGAIEKVYLAKTPVFKPITFTLSHVLEPKSPRLPEPFPLLKIPGYIKFDHILLKIYYKQLFRVRLEFKSNITNALIAEWFSESIATDRKYAGKVSGKQQSERMILRESAGAEELRQRQIRRAAQGDFGSNNVGDGSVNKNKIKE